MNRAKVLGMT